MGSVSSTNPGLASVLQTLSSLNSPLLSSPNAVSALENASPSEIVGLSAATTQLQEVDAIFGASAASPDTSSGWTSFTNLEAALTTPLSTSPTLPGSSSAAVPASQIDGYQSSLQAAEADALLDPASAGTPPGSLISLIG